MTPPTKYKAKRVSEAAYARALAELAAKANRKDTDPTHLYVGLRDAVMAEVGTPDYYEGKYLISPYGDGQYDSEGCNTKAEVKECVREYVKQMPWLKVVWL